MDVVFIFFARLLGRQWLIIQRYIGTETGLIISDVINSRIERQEMGRLIHGAKMIAFNQCAKRVRGVSKNKEISCS